VAEAAYDDIVDEVQATFSTEGQVGRLGRSVTWRTENPVLGKKRALQVRVASRGGQTRIQVQERVGEMATALYTSILVGGGCGGIGTILGIGLGWLGYGVESAALSVAWLGGTYALTRSIFRAVVRSKRTDLVRLSDRIAEIAADSTRRSVEDDKTTPDIPG
jgi:hypothetical protein